MSRSSNQLNRSTPQVTHRNNQLNRSQTSSKKDQKDQKMSKSKSAAKLQGKHNMIVQGNKVSSFKNMKTFKEDIVGNRMGDYRNRDLEKPLGLLHEQEMSAPNKKSSSKFVKRLTTPTNVYKIDFKEENAR